MPASAHASAPVTVDCPYCTTPLSRRAKRCSACAEWVVPTQLRPAAQALRAVGYIWLVLSTLGAVVLWLNDVPLLGGAAGTIALFLQGLLVGLVAVVIAENGPRAPE